MRAVGGLLKNILWNFRNSGIQPVWEIPWRINALGFLMSSDVLSEKTLGEWWTHDAGEMAESKPQGQIPGVRSQGPTFSLPASGAGAAFPPTAWGCEVFDPLPVKEVPHVRNGRAGLLAIRTPLSRAAAVFTSGLSRKQVNSSVRSLCRTISGRAHRIRSMASGTVFASPSASK